MKQIIISTIWNKHALNSFMSLAIVLQLYSILEQLITTTNECVWTPQRKTSISNNNRWIDK